MCTKEKTIHVLYENTRGGVPTIWSRDAMSLKSYIVHEGGEGGR